MVTALRLIQIISVLLIIPMMALGGMSMFSGGGSNPAFQEIGNKLVMHSIFFVIPALIASEIVYRLMKHTSLPDYYLIAVIVALIPVIIWGRLIFMLQMETGFFSF